MATPYLEAILSSNPNERAAIYANLDDDERKYINRLLDGYINNKYLIFEDDPVGFIEKGLGETLWTKQKEIVESVRDNKRTAVPACHAPGKSHIAARMIAWWIAVHPVGTAQVVTTATTFRQVKNILWPHIRKLVKKSDIGGEVNQVEWKIDGELVAFGFSPADTDETAVQGIHAPHLLVVVDEAGGLSQTLGVALESLMTGGHTRLLLLGNPPTDNEDSWFERACNSDLYNVIPIGAYDTPNFTGEVSGVCRSCPPSVADHQVATHLVDEEWVQDVINEFGEESAFVEARVHARFPRMSSNRTIPYGWLEGCIDNEDHIQDNKIRLGVDVAADGGDEFVIAWADGFIGTVRHRSSGKTNANPVDVAGMVLEQIRLAEQVHKERQIKEPVMVKVDSIGVGWGVTGILKRWRDEQMHSATIIGVNVSERAKEAGKFHNQRAEMWWNMRTLVQPQVADGVVKHSIRLDVDTKTLAQLSGPTYKSDSSGRIVIEAKKDMKRRGMHSPDRAEAVLLAFYNPPGSHVGEITFGSITQSNEWRGV
jgi:hypothetical protein